MSFKDCAIRILLSLIVCSDAFGTPLSPLKWENSVIEVSQSEDDKRFHITISENQITKDVQLSYHFDEIISMLTVGDRLIVHGDQGYGSVITLIDLANAKQILETSCFRPAFSPDNTYVVFERFFPRRVPPEFYWPQVEIVDILADSPRTQALFPPYEPPSRDSADFTSRKIHTLVSPLVWSQESRYLIYFLKSSPADAEDAWEGYTIQLMVFKFDAKRANTIMSFTVDVSEFVNKSLPVPPQKVTFAVREMHFVDGTIVEATLSPQEYRAFTKFKFNLDEVISSGDLKPLPSN